MKLKRHGILAGLALTATLALAACGSDNNSNSPGSGSSSNGNGIKCASGSLTAQGSTAQGNAMNQWIKDYQTACSGATINYQGTGSGAGQNAFISGTADFAGSDSPFSASDQPKADQRCKTGPAIHLPMVVGPIAVVFNVSGVSSLQLKPATIAKIFTGKITKWNDPLIAADNSGASLPATPILTVHRADSSGTTDNFTKYLGAAAPSDYTLPHDKNWKASGGSGQQGSAAVAAAVKAHDGSIGYVEWSFAQVNSLNMAKVANASGAFVALSGDGAGATIASAQPAAAAPDLQLKIDYNTTNPAAYPIVLVTYEIVCSKGNDSSKLALLKNFLSYAASTKGQQAAVQVGYAPLPDSVRTQVASAINNLS